MNVTEMKLYKCKRQNGEAVATEEIYCTTMDLGLLYDYLKTKWQDGHIINIELLGPVQWIDD